MRQSRRPVPAAAGSSLDTVTISARKGDPKLPFADTAHQLELPGLEDTLDLTHFEPLTRPERRRLKRGKSPCCSAHVINLKPDPEGQVALCPSCCSLYLTEPGGEAFAVYQGDRPATLPLTPEETP